MSWRIVFLISALCIPLRMLAEEPAEDRAEATAKQERALTTEQREKLTALAAQEKRGVLVSPRKPLPHAELPKLPGQWVERDGDRYCDGYLTRIEDDEFCSSEVPADWEPFEFDGMTFFVQPLSDKESR